MSEKMLLEIANDSLTPKKSDKQSSSDLFERLREEDEDGLDYEIESYEVISEYRQKTLINKIQYYKLLMPAQRVSKSFKDLSMSFKFNPLSGDLITLKNENAIARAVRNIVSTTPGEKLFDPEFGSSVSEILFENVDDITAVSIEDEIQSCLGNYEPRVELIDVDVDPNFDENQFDVLITYRIVGVDIPPSQLEFALLPSR